MDACEKLLVQFVKTQFTTKIVFNKTLLVLGYIAVVVNNIEESIWHTTHKITNNSLLYTTQV